MGAAVAIQGNPRSTRLLHDDGSQLGHRLRHDEGVQQAHRGERPKPGLGEFNNPSTLICSGLRLCYLSFFGFPLFSHILVSPGWGFFIDLI